MALCTRTTCQQTTTSNYSCDFLRQLRWTQGLTRSFIEPEVLEKLQLFGIKRKLHRRGCRGRRIRSTCPKIHRIGVLPIGRIGLRNDTRPTRGRVPSPFRQLLSVDIMKYPPWHTELNVPRGVTHTPRHTNIALINARSVRNKTLLINETITEQSSDM